MKTTSLIEAVRQITGNKYVSESEARNFASNNYLELVLFHNYEQKREELIKEICLKKRQTKLLKTFGIRINGLKR